MRILHKVLKIGCLGIFTVFILCNVLGCSNFEKIEDITVRVGGLLGPTSMGLVKLMQDSENNITQNKYKFADLSTDPAAFTAPLIKGDLDFAAVPSNLASTLYNNSDGQIQVVAINTLNVLKVLEKNGETIKSISDLKGKKVYATGQGATPEYIIKTLLEKENILNDVNINWVADTTQMLAVLSKESDAIAIVPMPFAFIAKSKIDNLKIALDLGEIWEKYFNEEIVTGVMVARKDFIKNNKVATKVFLKEYKQSIDFTNNNVEEASKLIEKYIGIDEKIAKKVIPMCNIKYISSNKMKDTLSVFLEKIYKQDRKSIGNNIPKADFYYEQKD